MAENLHQQQKSVMVYLLSHFRSVRINQRISQEHIKMITTNSMVSPQPLQQAQIKHLNLKKKNGTIQMLKQTNVLTTDSTVNDLLLRHEA